MTGPAIAVIIVLALIAVLHLYWGVGGLWPGKDGPDLSSRVAGTRSNKPAGFGPCATVAALLLAAAYVVGVGAQIADPLGLPSWFWLAGAIVVGLLFLLRGIAAYLPRVFDYARGTPFHELNRRYYAPLCLIIAVGVIASISGA